ncbi:MAG: hypothetical protein ACE5GT_03075 [Rhodospirillales bacterium]
MNDISFPTRRRVIAFIGAFIAAGALGPGGAVAQAPEPEAKAKDSGDAEGQRDAAKPDDAAKEWKERGQEEGKKEIERTDLPEDLRRLTTRDKKKRVKKKLKKVKHKRAKRTKAKRKKVKQKKVD